MSASETVTVIRRQFPNGSRASKCRDTGGLQPDADGIPPGHSSGAFLLGTPPDHSSGSFLRALYSSAKIVLDQNFQVS